MDTDSALRQAAFDIYGYRFLLRSSCRYAFDGLCQDFAFFRSDPGDRDHVIEMHYEAPEYERLPGADASMHTPRNVVYQAGSVRYIDYHGRGVGEHDRATGAFRMWSEDPDILYEAVYLFLLSQCGAFLDARRMHRVHALGMSVNGKAVLVLLPMGGGKSTLGHDMLKHPDVRILSDDAPLLDVAGRVYAFPLRLGLLPGHAADIPQEHQRTIQRMEFGPKILVNFDYFADRVAPEAEPGLVFVATRSLSMECRIERASLSAGLRSMVTNCVVGLGLFQGVEFVLSRRTRELFSLVGVAGSRLRSSVKLLRRSEVYHLSLGRDRALNARTVVDASRRLLH